MTAPTERGVAAGGPHHGGPAFHLRRLGRHGLRPSPGSVVTGATFRREYRSATAGDTTCYYFEVYNGVTLLGTHGSPGSPLSCNATGSYANDAVALREIDTVAEANAVSIKLFVRNSCGGLSVHRQTTLGVTSSLD